MSDAPIWLRWVRLAARRRVEEVRGSWRGNGASGIHAVIDAIVADTPAATRSADDEVLDGAGAAVETDPRWGHLVETFSLAPEERQLLALLAAVHVDPRLSRVLGYVEDDPYPRAPTPAAAARLWGWPPGTVPAASGALVEWRIATPHDEPDPWQPTTPWLVDSDVVAYLCGNPRWASFWPGVEHVAAGEDAACLYPELLDELTAAADALTGAEATRPVEIDLVGRSGSGRRTLLRQLCTRLGRDALVIRTPALGVRALRTARLLDAVPLWVADEPLVDHRAGALTLVARETPATASQHALRLTWPMPELPRAARLRLWEELAPGPVPPLVDEWTLTPSEVATAAAAAPGGASVVSAVARRRLGAVSNTLMTPVRCPYDWDDLVVAEGVLSQLRELESQVRLADAVLEGWDFRRLTPTSRGTTALFAGPSGTGKTMSAQVLARSLDLDLYRVDLAEVVNKYIGETEKRLAHVFDECERCNVMVLFDEADALFGRRTRVRDSHDRFANIEIDYLLQRMDAFDGIAILATNRKGDLDAAFVRRIRIIVDFLAPTAVERKRLWELALPPHVSDGIDHEWLAATLTLTGAEIKAAALGAAFRARAANDVVGTEHVLAAVRRELAKHGTVLRGEANGSGGRVVVS